MKLRSVFFIVSVFVFGAIASSVGGMWHPYVTVKVTNMSQQSIKDLEVAFQNTEGKGAFNLYIDKPLKTGEEMIFHFYVESEGAFALKATFSNEQVVKGISEYIERGNTRVIEIQSDRMKEAR
jgi:hypothetical protein